jgi:hypothetical protein
MASMANEFAEPEMHYPDPLPDSDREDAAGISSAAGGAKDASKAKKRPAGKARGKNKTRERDRDEEEADDIVLHAFRCDMGSCCLLF